MFFVFFHKSMEALSLHNSSVTLMLATLKFLFNICHFFMSYSSHFSLRFWDHVDRAYFFHLE